MHMNGMCVCLIPDDRSQTLQRLRTNECQDDERLGATKVKRLDRIDQLEWFVWFQSSVWWTHGTALKRGRCRRNNKKKEKASVSRSRTATRRQVWADTVERKFASLSKRIFAPLRSTCCEMITSVLLGHLIHRQSKKRLGMVKFDDNDQHTGNSWFWMVLINNKKLFLFVSKKLSKQENRQ